jgi:hypothetical protein
MSTDLSRSPAAKVMDEAIDLAIEDRSPYPEKAAFIDADPPSAGHAIERAVDQGLSVVLVSADGTARVLRPDLAAH